MRYLNILLIILLFGCDVQPQPQPPQQTGGVVMVGNMVAPTTTLDQQGMQIQEQQGCVACHTKGLPK